MEVRKPILSVENLTLSYGKTFSLKKIQFNLFPGEIVGLIGTNGSGKTTLIEALIGLIPTSEKSIICNECKIEESEIKKHIFYIPDAIRPYPTLSVDQVLKFYQESFGRSKNDLQEVIVGLELTAVLEYLIKHLSKGFARRFLLAIGFLSTQPILALDEPLDGFDVRQLQRVIPLFQNTARLGRTLFVCIHQLTDAERFCDRFIIMNEGRIIAQGSKNSLLQKVKTKTNSLEEVILELT